MSKVLLENLILDILRKKQKVTENELKRELKKFNEDISTGDLYFALLRLELFEKILVIQQRNNKLIILKEAWASK